MSISDAASVQTVLHYLLGTQPEPDDPADLVEYDHERQVLQSLIHLADRSRRILHAGVDGEQVRSRWVYVP
jgi:hypothetical protein